MKDIYQLQSEYKQVLRLSTAGERKKKLRILEHKILEFRPKIREALFEDLKKSAIEADLTEIMTALSEIRFMRRNLASWMRNKSVPTPIELTGTSSYLKYESKGTVLIIAPWNYPLNLTLLPIAGAIAAGNTAIVKPSEMAPATSRVIKELISEIFEEKEIAVIEGGKEISKELLKLKFDHIFFTGSPGVGKIIMKAAADHLSEITLELGGKTPALIDKSANLKRSAKRLVWSKMVNNGQTCITADYILVQKDVEVEFLAYLKEYLTRDFGNGSIGYKTLSRIINKKHFSRIMGAIEEALAKGAKRISVGDDNSDEGKIGASIMTGLKEDDILMEEEIFGPLLPVIPFDQLDEAIGIINNKDKPLALYVYGRNRKRISRIINETSSGAVVVNNGLLHFSNKNLPFGGVNGSGIGKYHGKRTFLAFSNEKAVLKQWLPLSAASIFKVPYSKTAKRLVDFMVRWM